MWRERLDSTKLAWTSNWYWGLPQEREIVWRYSAHIDRVHLKRAMQGDSGLKISHKPGALFLVGKKNSWTSQNYLTELTPHEFYTWTMNVAEEITYKVEPPFWSFGITCVRRKHSQRSRISLPTSFISFAVDPRITLGWTYFHFNF